MSVPRRISQSCLLCTSASTSCRVGSEVAGHGLQSSEVNNLLRLYARSYLIELFLVSNTASYHWLTTTCKQGALVVPRVILLLRHRISQYAIRGFYQESPDTFIIRQVDLFTCPAAKWIKPSQIVTNGDNRMTEF